MNRFQLHDALSRSSNGSIISFVVSCPWTKSAGWGRRGQLAGLLSDLTVPQESLLSGCVNAVTF